MSRLWVPWEAREWVASWLSEGSPGRAYRTISRVAAEQRACFDRCVLERRFLPGTSEEEYRIAIQIVENAVDPARFRWEMWELELDARREAERVASDAAMKDAGAKHRVRL
jgi:hypothetical protein